MIISVTLSLFTVCYTVKDMPPFFASLHAWTGAILSRTGSHILSIVFREVSVDG